MFGLESPDAAKVLIAAIGAFPLLVATLWGRDRIKKAKPANDEQIVEIKGAIIDNTRADRIVDRMDQLAEIGEKVYKSLDRNSDECAKMTRKLDQMEDSANKLAHEMDIASRFAALKGN